MLFTLRLLNKPVYEDVITSNTLFKSVLYVSQLITDYHTFWFYEHFIFRNEGRVRACPCINAKVSRKVGTCLLCILSMHCLSVLVWVSHLWLCNFECQMTLQSAASWLCSLLRTCTRGWTQHKCPVSHCCESSRGLHKTCGTPRCQHWLPMRWRPSIPQTGHEARDQNIKWEKADTRSRAINYTANLWEEFRQLFKPDVEVQNVSLLFYLIFEKHLRN